MKLYQNRNWLNYRYWRNGYSSSKLAKICGVNQKTILYWMEKLQIPTRSNYKHGDSPRRKRTRLYGIWAGMKTRCHDFNCKDYKYYGARGIKVDFSWYNYTTFRGWALANGYQENLTIDRINHKGNYEPSNCQWLTMSENSKKSRFQWKEK